MADVQVRGYAVTLFFGRARREQIVDKKACRTDIRGTNAFPIEQSPDGARALPW